MTNQINNELCTYSADSSKTYCGLGRGSHLYADHFFRQGQLESEFDKVFKELEAPNYPATCDNCGKEGTNASLETHACNKEQPMSDTLPEREDQMDIERINQIESKNADWCDDCHGYTHMPWCPSYKEPDTRRSGEVGHRTNHEQPASEYQPAARGGGGGELRPGMNPTCLRCFNDGWDAHQHGLHPANFHAGFATKDAPHTCNQHQALVAERDELRRVMRIIRDSYWSENEPYSERVEYLQEMAKAALQQRSTSE